MSDNGRLEAAAAWLMAGRERTDRWRFRAGLRAARMETAYGAGVIARLARDSGIPPQTLYEYRQVAVFIVRWKGRYSAARIFDDHPMLTYSHLRRAMRLDFEDAIDALLHAEGEGLTPDAFGVYVSELKGKDPPPLPLFDEEGPSDQVFGLLWQARQEVSSWHGKRLRVTVREVQP